MGVIYFVADAYFTFVTFLDFSLLEHNKERKAVDFVLLHEFLMYICIYFHNLNQLAAMSYRTIQSWCFYLELVAVSGINFLNKGLDELARPTPVSIEIDERWHLRIQNKIFKLPLIAIDDSHRGKKAAFCTLWKPPAFDFSPPSPLVMDSLTCCLQTHYSEEQQMPKGCKGSGKSPSSFL